MKWLFKGMRAMTIITELHLMWPAVKPRLDKLAASDPQAAEFVSKLRALIALFHKS